MVLVLEKKISLEDRLALVEAAGHVSAHFEDDEARIRLSRLVAQLDDLGVDGVRTRLHDAIGALSHFSESARIKLSMVLHQLGQ